MDMKEWQLQKTLERLRLSGRPQASNLEELKIEFMKWIDHLWEYQMCGDTLYDINRRYGPLCKRLGTSSKELVYGLAKEGKVIVEFQDRKTLVISHQFETLKENLRKDAGSDYLKGVEDIQRAQTAVFKGTLER